jgi:uncharacterized membrane protein
MKTSVVLPYLNPLHTHHPIGFIVERLLKKRGIKISTNLLHQKLTEHPYFPSLLSISDVLTEIGITSNAYKTNLDDLKQNFETAVLIPIQIEKGLFCILDKIKDRNFRVITENGEVKWFAEDDFIKAWSSGVLLDVQHPVVPIVSVKTDPKVYPGYLKNLLAICWAILTFYVLQSRLSDLNLQQGTLVMLNLSGTLVSWLLILQHLNKNNVLVQQLCQSKTQEGCNSVLNNKMAMITTWFSMAEAGFVYFAGMTFLILFSNSYSILHMLLFCAPAFSLFAIYLQAFVIKQWCRLCMAVHAIVFCSFSVSVYNYWGSRALFPSFGELSVFILPGLLWLFLKPYIIQLKDVEHFKAEYTKLKYNPDIFLALISKQTRINIPQSLKVFTLGNRAAENELTFVSNPYCGPCAIAHEIIDEWLKQELNFKINIIFIHSNDKNDRQRVFVQHIAKISDQEIFKEVIHAWFSSPGTKDISKWTEEYELQNTELPYDEAHLQAWVNLSEIAATPTFFINGYPLPKTY